MTGLVVAHHTAITYGGSGGWFYRELPTSGSSASSIALTLFCSVNQAFVMGLFFLIAGYLTPAALERKGPWRYLADRLRRLGLPLLLFGFVIGPFTLALAGTARGLPLRERWAAQLAEHRYEPGPLWFCQALLLFALGAVLWRVLRAALVHPAAAADVPAASTPSAATDRTALPAPWTWWAAALAVGAVAFALRLAWPTGTATLGSMQWGYFASYVFLFALGCRAWPGRWLERLPAAQVRHWRLVTRWALPLLPLTGLALGALQGAQLHFDGGWSLPALVYAFWEPLVAWGLIAALLQRFRLRHNQPQPRWDTLTPLAYAAFVLHAPVLVATSLALRGWGAPALLKFAVVAPLALALSLALGAALRRVPGVAQVL
ncbi:MAG: hypothetical protein RLZZ584_1314 [Pseudomonadota bacterium]